MGASEQLLKCPFDGGHDGPLVDATGDGVGFGAIYLTGVDNTDDERVSGSWLCHDIFTDKFVQLNENIVILLERVEDKEAATKYVRQQVRFRERMSIDRIVTKGIGKDASSLVNDVNWAPRNRFLRTTTWARNEQAQRRSDTRWAST